MEIRKKAGCRRAGIDVKIRPMEPEDISGIFTVEKDQRGTADILDILRVEIWPGKPMGQIDMNFVGRARAIYRLHHAYLTCVREQVSVEKIKLLRVMVDERDTLWL